MVGTVRSIVNALTLYSPEEIAKVNRAKEELLAGAEEAHQAGKARVREVLKKQSASV
ncbi:hypothetical protein [Sphingosinicella sp. CPCC 101087]|uniref:hypothetical protein n=1 Tax=Sphingosinicella sp. CPCC 101087 TaxID=2497754 RepID=UPI0013EC2ACC|nr:hypothetical protein [Sphingosinicella sp. CPCC 101087]